MDASASHSSPREAATAGTSDFPAGATETSVNEVGRESPGDSQHISLGNIGSHHADNAGASGPGNIMSTPTDSQSRNHIASGNVVIDNAAIPGTASPSQRESGSRPKPPQAATVTGIRFDVGKLVSLMEEQISLLRRIDERQAASDLTQQPMPEVSATSNSTWGALLRMTVAETIQPKVDRWRSGLDALLVFLGLFSAIVTAFLVESLNGLRPDEAERTNELLANLTDVMIALSGVNPMNLNLSTPAEFQPDSTDVRLNSYWSISLVLSLSVAALAVTCRGFLNMVTLSRHAKATDKLIDIKLRWKETDKMLGPVIEMIPQLLVIPVLLFVVGLLDSILSGVLQLVVLPTPIVATVSLSFFFIAAVIAFLAYSLFDGSARPHSSPFQSTLAGVISLRIVPMIQFWISWLQAQIKGICLPLHTSNPSLSSSRDLAPAGYALVLKHYHETVQAIHDDDTLDKASAALSSVLGPQRHIVFQALEEEEVATLVHLLSPEASIRANRTAAAAIAGWNSNIPEQLEDFYTTNCIPHKVLITLAQTARRSVGSTSLATLATSTFLAAMAKFVVRPSDPGPEHLLPIQILGSKYASLENKSDLKSQVIWLMCDILSNPSLGSNMDKQLWITTAAHPFRPATIRTSIVLQALFTLDNTSTRWSITEILMEAKTVQAVIRDALEVLDLLHDNSAQGLAMTADIVHVGRTRDDFSDHKLLCDLCVKCILNIMQDSNFLPDPYNPYHEGYWVAKGLDEIPITEEGLTGNFRAAIEYSIEMKGLRQPPATPRRVMGQNMPVSELTQLLHQMVETGRFHIDGFNLDAAIHDIRASGDI